MQWWQQRQIHRTHEEAELIRDGILQELFAIRRSLELAHTEQQPISQESLQQLETLHDRLEQVSNALSPAFSRDSLSLAIQHLLHQLQQQYPQMQVSVQLPVNHRSLSLSSRVALTAFEELLALVVETFGEALSLVVSLEYQNQMALLTVRVSGVKPGQQEAIAHLSDLSHLCHAFQFLTEGFLQQRVHDSWVEWQFRWLYLLSPATQPPKLQHDGQ